VNNSFTLITLYIAGFVGYSSFSLLLPVMPLYATELGAPLSQVGLIVAIYSYVTALALLPFGMLCDRLGRRNFLVAGLIIFVLAPLLYPWAANVQQLILVRAIHGLASATFIPASVALVVDTAPASRRGEALGWYTASTQLGLMAGPITGGFILEYLGFDAVFYSCSVISLLGLVFVLFRLAAISQKPVAGANEGSSWGWIKQRFVFAGLLTPLFIAIGSGTIATYIPIYGWSFSITEIGAGLIITALYASSALLRAPAGKLSDSIGRKPVILSGLVLCAVATAFISQFHSLSQLIIIAVFFGVGMGIAMPPSFALVADLSPAGMRGLAMGMTSCCLQFGLAIGATVMGIVAGASGFEVMFLACALSLTFGLTVIFGLMQGRR